MLPRVPMPGSGSPSAEPGDDIDIESHKEKLGASSDPNAVALNGLDGLRLEDLVDSVSELVFDHWNRSTVDAIGEDVVVRSNLVDPEVLLDRLERVHLVAWEGEDGDVGADVLGDLGPG